MRAMRIETGFLRTKVARRVLGLFVLCALLPIVALTVISYTTVARQLHQQSQSRMLETGKATAMSILERLQFLATELEAVASTWREAPLGRSATVDSSSAPGRILGLAVIGHDGSSTVLVGTVPQPPALDTDAMDALATGKTLLIMAHDGPDPSILMARAIKPGDPAARTLFASLDRRYLLAGPDGASIPTDMDLCVVDQGLNRLFCTLEDAQPLLRSLEPSLSVADLGLFQWGEHRQRYVASYRPLFLAAPYGAKPWTIVVSQAEESVLAPLTQFKRFFLPVILLALWVVLLLSNVQIRRSMAPLIELQAGTGRIAARDFDSRVQITSGDEFEDLAASFNAMAHRLGIQFNTLTAMSEIDRAVLSTLDADHIIDTVVLRTQEVLACDGVSVAMRKPNGGDSLWKAVAADPSTSHRSVLDVRVPSAEVAELEAHPEHFWLNGEDGQRSYLQVVPFVERQLRSFLVLPVLLKQELAGVIVLGYRVAPALGDDDLLQARRLADQMAVALSNTRLVEELNALNWGALTALARAIDAKSPWTAGHSERVTAMALTIGRHMGLPSQELDTLHRGGLLHDLGKIGVPADVLDKPTGLTPEEHQLMRQHTEIGARILGPIAAFAPVVPLVLHHHERWDGSGYPAGLAGENIPFLARVLAVPDVFDALTSERPYRAGLPLADAVEFIRQRGGAHFDPTVVDAFIQVMSREGAAAEIRRTSLQIATVRAS
jgi:response regulator RpfG family c-di-GMP phosphodiesterase/HAMP domain-containing protein